MLNEGNEEKLRAEFKKSKEPEPVPTEKDKDDKDKNNNIDDKPKPKKSPSPSRSSSPSRKAAEDNLEGKGSPPPKFTGFNSSELNDIVNGLNSALGEDSKEQGHDKPFTPAPGLGMPINSITAEEAKKMPWLCMGFEFEDAHG